MTEFQAIHLKTFEGISEHQDLQIYYLVTYRSSTIMETACRLEEADRFDVCEAAVYRMYRRVCKVIVTHFMDVFTKWPLF